MAGKTRSGDAHGTAPSWEGIPVLNDGVFEKKG